MRPGRARLAFIGVLSAATILAGCDDDGGGGPTTTTSISTTTTTSISTTTTAPTVTTGVPATTGTTAPAAPPQVTGLKAATGGGSGEVVVTWPPLPASSDVASYKLYKRRANGTELPPATVTPVTPEIEPGRIGVVDAPDTGPWPTAEDDPGPRCYKVSAVSSGGVEGPLSAEACGSPVGG